MTTVPALSPRVSTCLAVSLALLAGCKASNTSSSNNSPLLLTAGQSIWVCSVGTSGVVIPQTLLASGGTPTASGYSFNLESTPTPPTGLSISIDAASGQITGSVSALISQGSYPIGISVTDGTTTATGTITAAVNNGNVTINNGVYPSSGSSSAACPSTPFQETQSTTYAALASPATVSTLPTAISGESYGVNFFTAGSGVPSFSISAGALPPGLQINAENGTLYGSVTSGTSAGTYQFTVTTKSPTDNTEASGNYTINTTAN